MFQGLRIIESPLLTEPRECVVPRTWKARLWSWPWRPWVKTAVVTLQVPSMKGYQLNRATLVMHPEAVRELKRQLTQVEPKQSEAG